MRSFFLTIGFLLAFLIAIPVLSNESDLAKVDVTLIVNGKTKGVTLMNQLPGKNNYSFAGPLVLMALSDFLSEKETSDLEKTLAKSGFITSADLQKLGLSINFFAATLEIKITTKEFVHKEYQKKVSKTSMDSTGPEMLAPSAYRRDTIAPGLNDSSDLRPKVAGKDTENLMLQKEKKQTSSQSGLPQRNGIRPKNEDRPPPTENQEVRATPINSKPAISKPVQQDSAKILEDSVNTRQVTTTYSYPESKDALYEKIFKKAPPKRPENIEVTVSIDDKPWGKSWIKISNDQTDYSISLDTLMSALEERLIEESVKKIKLTTNKSGYITGKAILQQGIISSLKLDQFELNLQVPSQLLGTQRHNLSPGTTQGSRTDDYPIANFSGYLNTRMRQRIQYQQTSPNVDLSAGGLGNLAQPQNDHLRSPVTIDLDGALNLKSVVLESRAYYTEPKKIEESYFTREDIRLVYDRPKSSVRFIAGDLLFPTFGYQGFLKIGGIGASRDFSLQPNQIVYPTKDYQFFLENEAEVKVYVNGSLVSTLLLDPGPHDLQRIPMSAGVSEIKIDILDVTGRTQTVKFNFIFEPSLLAKGKSTFSYNLGIPGSINADRTNWNLDSNHIDFLGYRYASDQLATSLAWRYGVTNVWTAALYSQTLLQNGLLGINSLFAFPLGKINTDLAFTKIDSLGIDFGAKIGYSYVPKPGSNQQHIGWLAQIEYTGENFSRIQFTPIKNENQWTLSTGINKSLDLLSLNLTGAYNIKRESKNLYNLALNLRRQLFKGLNGNVSINHFFNTKNIETTTFSADFQYSFSTGLNNFNASQRAITHQAQFTAQNFNQTNGQSIAPAPPVAQQWDNTTDLGWDYNSSAPFPNNPRLSGTVSLAPTGNDYSGKVALRVDQGFLDLDGRRMEPAVGFGNYVQNQADLSLQTSFVFADGRFGISRPIQNGFLIVEGIKNLGHSDIVINPNESGYDAKSNLISAAVLPSLFPYSEKKIKLNVIDPPVGTSLEKTQFYLYPRYKSGYLISLGNDGDVVAMGTYKDRVGKALEYKVLKIYSVDDPKAPILTAFTNGVGRFQVPGVKSGKWKIEAVDVGYTTFIIPKKTVGLFQLGVLNMDPEN